MLYRDRRDAGRQLAAALQEQGLDRPIMLGIPRGGVPIAAELARILDCELALVVARKLGAPGHPELGIGAVASDGTVFVDPEMVQHTGASRAYIDAEITRQQDEAKRRERVLDAPVRDLNRRDAVVVDDGIATGATAVAALRSVRASGAQRAILAVPVAPPSSLDSLRGEADAIVCPMVVEDFGAVGRFYVDFTPVSEDQVRTLLSEAATQPGTTS